MLEAQNGAGQKIYKLDQIMRKFEQRFKDISARAKVEYSSRWFRK